MSTPLFLTEEQLTRLRQRTIDEAKAWEIDIKEFTCDGCPARFTCEYVYDSYNTNGDCLAEK